MFKELGTASRQLPEALSIGMRGLALESLHREKELMFVWDETWLL